MRGVSNLIDFDEEATTKPTHFAFLLSTQKGHAFAVVDKINSSFKNIESQKQHVVWC